MALPAFPPLHPVLVHIPVVLLPLAALLGTLAVVWKQPWAWTAMLVVLVLAAAGSFAAGLTGDDVENRARNQRALLETHKTLGDVVQWGAPVVAALVVWQRARLRAGTWAYVLLGVLWALAILVLVTGWYGGAMVWDRPAGTFAPPVRGNATRA